MKDREGCPSSYAYGISCRVRVGRVTLPAYAGFTPIPPEIRREKLVLPLPVKGIRRAKLFYRKRLNKASPKTRTRLNGAEVKSLVCTPHECMI